MKIQSNTRGDAEKSPVWIGKTQVHVDELVLLEAQGNYLRVVTDASETLERFRISEAVELLPEQLGLFVHRSRWVSFAAIQSVEQAGGRFRLTLRTEEVVFLASTREDDVLPVLRANGLMPDP